MLVGVTPADGCRSSILPMASKKMFQKVQARGSRAPCGSPQRKLGEAPSSHHLHTRGCEYPLRIRYRCAYPHRCGILFSIQLASLSASN